MTYEVCYVYLITLPCIVAMACFFQMKYILLEVELLYLCFFGLHQEYQALTQTWEVAHSCPP